MSAPLYRRRRPAVACIECRRRKVKCDRALPCGPCGHASLLCGYRNPNNGLALTDLRAGPTATDLSTPTTCEEDGTQTGAVSSSPINLTLSGSGSAGLPPLFPFSSRCTFPGDMGMNENEPADLPGRTVSHAKSLGCGKDYIQSSFGQSEHLNFLLHRSDHVDIQSLWEQCTHYARIIKSERSFNYYTQLDPPNITNNLLPKSTCDRLVKLYMHTFESVFRVLHIPTFMQQYELYWNNPQGASRAFPSTVALVLAIGACFISEADADELQLLASKWIAGAQFWLTESFEKFGIDLSVLQVSALLLLARQTVPDPSELLWISGDFPLRIAVGLGLHKEARIHFPEFSPLESEMRKRLWATILEMSIQSCLDTGMPPSISNDDFDSEPPSNIDDDDASNLSAAADIADGFTQSTIQRMLMQTMPVRLLILRYCNALKKAPGQDYQWVLRLGMQLDAMCQSHTATLQSYQRNTNSDTPKPTEFQIHLLTMLTRRFLLALHSPFAVEAKANQSFYFSRKVLTENALICLSPLQLVPQAPLPVASVPENQQHELLRLKLRGGDIIRHVLCHATAILIVEQITELEENAFPVLHSLSRDLFFHAIEESIDIFRRRIHAGETSVDIYVLFSCAMAQAKAMKAGLAPERQTVEPAKDSLNFCCELLKLLAQANVLSSLGLTEGLQVALESDLGASDLWESMSCDLTSAIGWEFWTLQLSEILHDDAKIRNLGIIGPDFYCDESKNLDNDTPEVSQHGVVFLRNQYLYIADPKNLVVKIGQLTGRPEASYLHKHPPSNGKRGLAVYKDGKVHDEVTIMSSEQNKKMYKGRCGPSPKASGMGNFAVTTETGRTRKKTMLTTQLGVMLRQLNQTNRQLHSARWSCKSLLTDLW